MSPVKNQGQCGSCWAFAVTEQVESQLVLSGAPQVTLSPQQLASCTADAEGCGGGDPGQAYAYLASLNNASGLAPDAWWPYEQSLTPDKQGRLPVHHVMRRSASEGGGAQGSISRSLRSLMDAAGPEQLGARDEEGNLALDYALEALVEAEANSRLELEQAESANAEWLAEAEAQHNEALRALENAHTAALAAAQRQADDAQTRLEQAETAVKEVEERAAAAESRAQAAEAARVEQERQLQAER